MYSVLIFPHPCQHLLCLVFLITAILVGMKRYLIFVLISISLMINDVSRLFFKWKRGGDRPRKTGLVALLSVTVRSGWQGMQGGRVMRIARVKWNSKTVGNNSTKIIRANRARHCSKCFYVSSHLTLGTLTPHIYRNISFRRILGGFLQAGSYILISGCSDTETFIPHDIFSHVAIHVLCQLHSEKVFSETPLSLLANSSFHLDSHL